MLYDLPIRWATYASDTGLLLPKIGLLTLRPKADVSQHFSYASHMDSPAYRAYSILGSNDLQLDSRKVVNVVIAKNFNFAQEDVQIQVMEVCLFSNALGRELIPSLSLFVDVEYSAAPPYTLPLRISYLSQSSRATQST